MGNLLDTAKTVYAAGPASNPHEPIKGEIISLFSLIESIIGTTLDGLIVGNAVLKATRALLYADLAHTAGTIGLVYNDGIAAYNGYYLKSGSSGSGAWTLEPSLSLPSTFAADLAAALSAIDGLESDIAGKLDNSMATARILGRTSASTGVVEQLTGAQVKPMLNLSKGDVGLGSVNNTSDADKPVSTDQASAISAAVAPAAAHIASTNNPHSTTKAQVGLSNVDNTSDTNKPVSTAQAAAIGSAVAPANAHIVRTDNPHSTTKAQVGLSNADNTADMVKPVSTPQLAEMDARTRRATKKKSIVPITLGDSETSLWLENGLLGGRGMTEQMRDSAIGGVISKVIPSAGITPLAVDGDTVVLWRTAEGLIGGPGLTPAMRKSAVSDVIKYVDPAHDITPLMMSDTSVFLWMDGDGTLHGPGLSSGSAPVAADAPIASDGRSLALLRAKLGSLRNGDNVKLKVATILSDSWGEMKQIPLALRNVLTQEWSIAGEGYRPAVADIHNLGPSTYTVSAGWTVVDGNATSSFPYGVGGDGKAIHTDLTTETVTWANVTGVEFRIWHYQHGGSFRWRVDAGSWTTVTADSSGTFATVAISGLSNAPHTLEIDTTPNAGRVSIVGLYSTGSGPGIEIERMGNSGTRSYRVAAYLPYMTAPIAQIQPDVVVVMLGTNDQANSDSPPSVYINTLRAGVEAIRAGAPDVGFIFVAPARSDYPGAILPLSQYRDALISFCQADGHEFYNMHDDWFAFDEADALGQWADPVHVSNAGAANLARALDRHFDLKG